MSISSGGASILSVTVRYRRADGTEGEMNIDSTYDAVFLTEEAVERFLLPFYVGTYGPAAREQLLEKLAEARAAIEIPIPRHKKLCYIDFGLRPDDYKFQP